ncbi:hypothetical protein ACFE04_012836 [Oxalis oulophora]
MNRGHVLQSSLVQQMINTGNPNWWSNSMRPPPPPPPPSTTQQFFTPNSSFFPLNYVDCQNNGLWSQLLMGGELVGEEEKQASYPNASMDQDHLKQENSSNSYYMQQHNYSNEDHHFHQASSPKSCVTTNNNNNNMMDFSSKKSNGRHPPPDRSNSEGNSPARGVKKARVQSTSGQSTIKVRKEKLGDRVTALHQIVSPFGKTDTASVLLETIGYIRFLHSQIEALSLPYMASSSGNNLSPQQDDSQDEPMKDLSSRGLCLVPISCTLQVGSDNGADFWAQSIAGGF